MPESLAQYEFYRQAIELSPDVFERHEPYDKLQKERDEVLDADVEDIRALADAIEAALADNCIIAIGNEDAIEKDADLFDKIESLNA
jgi:Zn-dependent M16 (insulinase) family peptidase